MYGNSLNGLGKPRLGTKFYLIILGWLALEAAAFWGVWQLIGSNSWWIILGFIILGVIVNPSLPSRPIPSTIEEFEAPPPEPKIPADYLPRKLAAAFFMIPTFLTDIIAILMLIKPVRRKFQHYILQKILPPGIAEVVAGGKNFQDMMKDAMSAGTGANPQDLFGQSKNRADVHDSKDVIDVDCEVDGKKRNSAKVENDRDYDSYSARKSDAPKVLEAEVIDVEHEWKE